MQHLRRLRPSPALAVACVALFVALGGTAAAVIPDTNGSVHTCYVTASGSLRVIDPSQGEVCHTGETPLDLASQSEVASQHAFAADEVSTDQFTLQDLGGPSVTVNAPHGGLVQLFAEAQVRSCAGGVAAVEISDASAPTVDYGGFGAESQTYESVYTSIVFNGTTGAGDPSFAYVAPGVHTFRLYYAKDGNKCGATGGNGAAFFRDRELWATLVPGS